MDVKDINGISQMSGPYSNLRESGKIQVEAEKHWQHSQERSGLPPRDIRGRHVRGSLNEIQYEEGP